jgi:hypothetical protein
MVVVGKVKSTNTSAGSIASTHPTNDLFVDIVGPIGVPAESQSLIVTYNSIWSFSAGLSMCIWNL